MKMEKRVFGRSGMLLSILGFGCGAVGGLMVRGDPADQERAVVRALEAGVNYFDTAVAYGDGEFGEKSWPHSQQTETRRRNRWHQGTAATVRFHPYFRRRQCVA